MKKSLFIFLISFLIFIVFTLHFIDKVHFICPIEYEKGLIIREDDWGSGYFGALRKGNRRHEGIDLYAQIGTEVRAVRFARVEGAGFHKNLGNYVKLRHPGNLTTTYGHLDRIVVRSGQWVAQNKIIGYVGKTGNANHPGILPHLHFEIRRENIPIDPQEWLERE